KEPELYAQGAIDLNTADFIGDNPPRTVTVKLYSALDLMKIHRKIATLPQVGTATVAIQKL
ncbi:MAG: hypothetical protein J6Y80_06025, partial [Victivallales bacterium]|nr:hypothetical protein [Victivallales bacterium]